MTEIWFYHLERRPLESVLPALLEKTLERGWKAVVQGTTERLSALDEHLWTYSKDSFLPHALASEPGAETQPILLTDDCANPNGAQARFLIDGARPDEALAASPYERLIVLFDGADDAALAAARADWKALKAHGHSVAYWRQSEAGRWEKIA